MSAWFEWGSNYTVWTGPFCPALAWPGLSDPFSASKMSYCSQLQVSIGKVGYAACLPACLSVPACVLLFSKFIQHKGFQTSCLSAETFFSLPLLFVSCLFLNSFSLSWVLHFFQVQEGEMKKSKEMESKQKRNKDWPEKRRKWLPGKGESNLSKLSRQKIRWRGEKNKVLSYKMKKAAERSYGKSCLRVWAIMFVPWMETITSRCTGKIQLSVEWAHFFRFYFV